MPSIFRPLIVIVAFVASINVIAQGGIRAILWNYEPILAGQVLENHVGLGYDHDVNDRMSFGVDLRIGLAFSSYTATYRSAYHFSESSSTSIYMGPNIGIRRIGSLVPQTMVPIGFRFGLRGGLERWYGDLHCGVVYNIGGGRQVSYRDPADRMDLRTTAFVLGLDIGFGWDR